jgi:adenosylcobinamide kinase/adenosylcobinamide-phosphate guanylyltransferase
MSNIWFITGGGRSGKSAYAESLLSGLRLPKNSGVLFIATGIAIDEEMKERIMRHQKSRPKNWITWERYSGYADIEKDFKSEAFGTILLDCVSNLLMGILFEEIPDPDDFESGDFDSVERLAIAEVDTLINYAIKYDKRLIFVTNEVGMGIIPETRYARLYRDALGRINKHIAIASDEAVLMVAGLPVKLK